MGRGRLTTGSRYREVTRVLGQRAAMKELPQLVAVMCVCIYMTLMLDAFACLVCIA